MSNSETAELRICRWEWCVKTFHTKTELASHLVQSHVRGAKRIATAELKTWKGQDGQWYGREMGFDTQFGDMSGNANSTRSALGEGSSTSTVRPDGPGDLSRLPGVGLTIDEEQAFMDSYLRSPSPSGTTIPQQSSESHISPAALGDKTSVRTDATTPNASHSSRPQTQQVPLDPDTTVSSSGSARAITRTNASSPQRDSPVRPSTASSGILSQQSRDSGTIPASFPHDTIPSILPSPPPSTSTSTSTSTSRVTTTTTTTAVMTTSISTSRAVSSVRDEPRVTPLKASSGGSSSTTSAHSPIISRFEFGKVVHESPQGEPLDSKANRTEGDLGPTLPNRVGEQDLSKRVQAAVGHPIGRTVYTVPRAMHSSETPTRPSQQKRKLEGDGEDEVERGRTLDRSAAGVRFGFGQSAAPAQARGNEGRK